MKIMKFHGMSKQAISVQLRLGQCFPVAVLATSLLCRLFGLVWPYFVRMNARLARFLLGQLAWLTVSSYSLQYILYFYVLNLQF
jgi:hypothetical protein